MEWTKVSKKVIDKAPEITKLKKGELQIKYAEALVRIDKAYDWVVKYQTEWCQHDEVIDDLSQLKEILQGKEGASECE